jgi:erythronate-4-phosphate dehydrogenase
MRKEIIFIDKNIPMLPEFLRNFGKINIFSHDELNNNLLKEKRATALFSRSTIKINEELLGNIPLKYYATATSGSDHMDKKYLDSQGINYYIALGSNANSVAEYVIFSILHWANYSDINIKNKIIGIIGYGAIGNILAEYCSRLGLKIIVNDPPLRDNNFDFPENIEYCDLEKLIEKSDIITNHVPLNKSGKYKTERLLSENISGAKNCKFFIHTSRGGVVSENSLIKYKNKHSFETVIDVWEDEPNFNSEMVRDSMIATPHIAGHSFNGKINGSVAVASDFIKYLGLKGVSEFQNNLPKRHTLKEMENIENIYILLNKNRKILSDGLNFKKTINFSENDKERFFKEYRNNYEKRFESLRI